LKQAIQKIWLASPHLASRGFDVTGIDAARQSLMHI